MLPIVDKLLKKHTRCTRCEKILPPGAEIHTCNYRIRKGFLPEIIDERSGTNLDSRTTYRVHSALPWEKVEEYCTTVLDPCTLTTQEYLRDRSDPDANLAVHFRPHYSLQKTPGTRGEYTYVVTRPTTD